MKTLVRMVSRVHSAQLLCAVASFAIFGCGGGDGDTITEPAEVTLEHCSYEDVPGTAGAGGTVAAGALQAGAAEAIIDVPVSTALGAYTARANFLGTSGTVDLRKVPISGSFNPSIGVESAPRIKVLALSAGTENVVIVKIDLGLVYEGMIFDVEKRLGPEFHGKVIISASHSHSAWGQQTASFVFKVGLGDFRALVYERYIDTIEATAREALEARRPAKIGILADFEFDMDGRITRDRRSEDNELMGGSFKDSSMFMIRVDGIDDVPIAALPVYGVHGTLMDVDNSFASADAPGGAERWLEEQFDSKVVVMHLQGAGGSVSPIGRGSLDCDNKPGKDSDPCFNWLQIEGHGRTAAPTLYAAWEAAGADMKTELELEMMTRSIETGPNADTFSIRDGALTYASFDLTREADREIWAADGTIISPIDEFNAPVGAALCDANLEIPETAYPMFPDGLMPGTDLLPPYGACVRINTAAAVLGPIMSLPLDSVDETHPVCQSTRTTISALRLGDFVLGTIPGELTIPLADQIRSRSPVDPQHTIVLGYAQGHIGYCLIAEDWLAGGYEPSINAWGPLEAEYVGEQLSGLLSMAATPAREDGTTDGDNRIATPVVVDDLPIDNPAVMAGTIPSDVPDRVWLRTGPAASAQPSPQISRVGGHATFVWIGDDPHTKTPVVTLERETSTDVFETVRRRSGRALRSTELLLMYTPLPVRRDGNEPQTHYWAAEWQAVPWAGAQDGDVDLDGMTARGGVPLGRYRFSVKGDAFDITSAPFEVVPATLGVNASKSGSNVSAGISFTAERGYRLLDFNGPSNGVVPVRGGTFDVELSLVGGGSMSFTGVVADASGMVTVDAESSVDDVNLITVTDVFGNAGTAVLP